MFDLHLLTATAFSFPACIGIAPRRQQSSSIVGSDLVVDRIWRACQVALPTLGSRVKPISFEKTRCPAPARLRPDV